MKCKICNANATGINREHYHDGCILAEMPVCDNHVAYGNGYNGREETFIPISNFNRYVHFKVAMKEMDLIGKEIEKLENSPDWDWGKALDNPAFVRLNRRYEMWENIVLGKVSPELEGVIL